MTKLNPKLAGKTAGSSAPAAESEIDTDALRRLGEAREQLLEQIGRVILGQQEVVDDLLTAIFARGHCLMVGVPGLAKTLMVSTIAQAIDLKFNRIQFTPDLMPADITGTEVIEENKATGERVFRFVKGPVFGNILLADEINRTPPKTQAALLQAMQERQVTSAVTPTTCPAPSSSSRRRTPSSRRAPIPCPRRSSTGSCSC